MNNRLYQTLEFDKVLQDLSGRALSSPGVQRLLSLKPLSDPGIIQKRLDQTSELCTLMDSGRRLPITRFEDITAHLDMAAVEGSCLEPQAFQDVYGILQATDRVHRFLLNNGTDCPLLQEIGRPLTPNPQLAERIEKSIDMKTLGVRSQASADLAAIRRAMAAAGARVRIELDGLLERYWRQGILQEHLVTKRQDRWVLPVKETHRHRVRGVLHDQSASGATFFIEPLHILEMTNKVRRLEAEERHEVERILRRLTDLVRSDRRQLEQNLDTLVSLDCIHAMALTAKALRQHAPALASGPLMCIKGGRHPLLQMREQSDSPVVPLDLSIGQDFNTLVITGPNAGGKTVALKTVGLLALMVSCGLHIPADPDSQIPAFDRIFAHIGDAQSIEMNLSTFSAHIKSIKAIVDEAASGDLVLIDEIGTGTDPQEGSALAIAILEVLTKRGTLTIVTTHQGTLKAFAHQAPGMANGSMAFDSKTLTPAYRFHPHLPGSSYALEIADRMGISRDIIRRSRALMGRQAHRVENLISELHEQVNKNEERERRLKAQERILAGLRKQYEAENDRLSRETIQIREKAARDAKTIIRRANAAVETAIRTIREERATSEAIREAKNIIEEEKRRLSKEVEAFSSGVEYGDGDEIRGHYSPGDRVHWKKGAVTAVVVSEEDSTGHVLIAKGNMKLRVPRQELSKPESLQRMPMERLSRIDFPSPKRVRSEIDLRGMHVEEALETVDKALNDALLSGLSEIQIIHGLGTGALRNNVIPFLKEHPLVAEAFPGGSRQENIGVTVVRIGGRSTK